MFTPKRASLTLAAVTGLLVVGGLAADAALSPTPEGFTTERSADLAAQIDPSKPRNVILIIGDGMDDSMITAARNYEYGAGGRFPALDALPFTGAMTTYGLKAGAGPDYPKAYVSDSAPTASGWSTGKKTIDGRVSQGPSAAGNIPGENYETVLEKYQAEGKLVGNVTTSEITDATPAAAAAHMSQRGCQGPTDMTACATEKKSAGGLGAIAEQLVDHKIDVLLGGGKNRYVQATDAGPSVLDYATTTKGYRLVENKAALDGVTSLAGGPVLGLFSGGNMTPRYNPLVATPPPGAGGPTARCTDADRANQPDLSAMTAKAIDLLDNPDGFFLQAESAMIDKQEHASDICGAIGDLRELDEAVQVALDYQVANPDTLVIVTGDHSHSTQIVGGVTDGKQTATLLTADGDPMTVAYSTSDVGSDHTGAQIRVAASGPQAANVTGVIDQTDLFRTLLGRTPSVLPGGQPAVVKPAVSVAADGPISRSELQRRGVQVAVAATGATTVKVSLSKGDKTLTTRTLSARGGTTTLQAKTGPGVVKVVATAVGAGGTTKATKSVRVTR